MNSSIAHSATTNKTANDHHSQAHAQSDHSDFVLIFKTGDESVTSSTTLQNDDDIVVAVGANKKWHFRLILRLSGSSSGDHTAAWSLPAGASGEWWNIADLTQAVADTEPLTTQQGTGIAASERMVVYEGYLITAGTAGNFQYQWAQETSNGTATVEHEESHLMMWRE